MLNLVLYLLSLRIQFDMLEPGNKKQKPFIWSENTLGRISNSDFGKWLLMLGKPENDLIWCQNSPMMVGIRADIGAASSFSPFICPFMSCKSNNGGNEMLSYSFYPLLYFGWKNGKLYQFCEIWKLYQFCEIEKLYQFGENEKLHQFCEHGKLYQLCEIEKLYQFCETEKLYQFCEIKKLYQFGKNEKLYQFCEIEKLYQFGEIEKLYQVQDISFIA